MLDGLDDIDWGSLQHAYGSAGDVPGLIRALASPSPDERRAAIYELHGNLWHQGTIYEATPCAVPFLIELASSKATPDRHNILSYLGTLAGGTSYTDVHRDFHKLPPLEFSARLRRELAWVEETRTAVNAGRALYLAALCSKDHRMCCAAAYVLSRYPEKSEGCWEPLRKRYEAAPNDELIRCGIAMLTNEFSEKRTSDTDWLAAMFEQESLPSVRVALAASIALSDRPPSDGVLQCLTANLLEDKQITQVYQTQPWDHGEPIWFVIQALCASKRGTRMLISRFNQMLIEGVPKNWLEYIRYVLNGKQVDGIDQSELTGPLRPLTLPAE